MDGTSTSAMQRDVKSELFDKLTGISKAELSDLLKQVLAAKEQLVSADGEEDNEDATVEEDGFSSFQHTGVPGQGGSSDGDGG